MRKLAAAGLRPQAQVLLAILAADPFKSPPPFEKLVGGLIRRRDGPLGGMRDRRS